MKKAVISQDGYKSAAVSTSAHVKRQSEKLTDISRNLLSSQDFSPCTIESMRTAVKDLKALCLQLDQMCTISTQRGLTALEEERVRAISDLDARRQKLLDGTLRINRRAESDLAAE